MRRVFVLAIALALSIPCFAQWVARYNGPGNRVDKARAIAVDGTGNVYVTGSSEGPSPSFSFSYATIKYNSSGTPVWIRRYSGRATGITVDGTGNVYVTGTSWGSGTGYDYATIKYNSSGDSLWVRKYNGSTNGADWANAIAVDDSGNVYVTGGSDGSGTYYDYATIKYNSAGDTVWVRRYSGPGSNWDEASAIAVDSAGNVYVTGKSVEVSTNSDYATIKYNSSGDTVWVRRYDGPENSRDAAAAIAVDGDSNVYVTGYSKGLGTDTDYATIKYNSSGDTVWVRRYDGAGGPGYSDDCATAIAVDDSDNVYVTGYSKGAGTSFDYATIKYNSLGAPLWVRRYNRQGDGGEEAYAIAIDKSSNVYVTGVSYDSSTSCDYATIKYNPAGDELWVRRYNGPRNDYDEAYAIAVDDSDNVYVTGYSKGAGTSFDYATIKYSCAGVEERDKRLEIGDWRLQIYPNPSFGNAVIKYGVPEKANMSLRLYDISGRLVKTIYSGTQEKGYYEVDIKQDELKGGIYFIRFEADKFKATRKLTILR